MNISADNVIMVISNLTSIVSLANATSDQNSDNLRVIADSLTQSVELIKNFEVAKNVSSNVHACMYYNSDLIFQVTANAIEILNSVGEWPMEIVHVQTNK